MPVQKGQPLRLFIFPLSYFIIIISLSCLLNFRAYRSSISRKMLESQAVTQLPDSVEHMRDIQESRARKGADEGDEYELSAEVT